MDAYPIAPAVTLAGDPPYPIDIAWTTDSGPVSIPFKIPNINGVFQYFNRAIVRSLFQAAAVHPDTKKIGSHKWTRFLFGIDPAKIPEPTQEFEDPPSPWGLPDLAVDLTAYLAPQSSHVGGTSVYRDGAWYFEDRPFRDTTLQILPYADLIWTEGLFGSYYIQKISFPAYPYWGDWGDMAVDLRTLPYDAWWPAYSEGSARYPYQCYTWYERIQTIVLCRHPVIHRPPSILPSLAALAFLGSMMLAGGTPVPRPLRK